MVVILCTACEVNIEQEGASTAAPEFVTVTLPATQIPPPTRTPVPPTALPTVAPIEGTTNTQVNVRVEPSTASQSLGIISAFAKIQVIGKEASGTWYQVAYAESPTGHGWVRAEYVQVNDAGAIPLVGESTGSGSGVSGLVIEKMNVRSGPGTEFESLGVLSPNDVVFISGKDASEAWAQIEFANAPEGKGWGAVKFLKINNFENVSLVEGTINEADTAVTPTPSVIVSSAAQDGDTLQAPLTTVIFSPAGARTLQLHGDVSTPSGDVEDWMGFSAYNSVVSIRIQCTSKSLLVELWNNDGIVEGFSLSCGDEKPIFIANSNYFLRIYETNKEALQYTSYVLNIGIVR